MAKDAIEAVKGAEEKAKSLINEANSAYKNSVLEAEKKAEQEYDKILTLAYEEAKKIKENFVREGEDIAEPILQEGNLKVQKLNDIRDDALEDSVNIIIERIVNANGNS